MRGLWIPWAVALPVFFSTAVWGQQPASFPHPPVPNDLRQAADRKEDLVRSDPLREPGARARFEADVTRVLAAAYPDAKVTLTLYSTREGQDLFSTREDEAFIPASNLKLVTTYAGLTALSPDFKWETRFDLVTVGQTPEGKNKHALLVTGTGDPTVTYGDMEEIATKLRLKGVRNLEGGIYYDDSFFDDKSYTRDWKESLGEQAWLAPISPFIFNNNTVSFFVSGRKTKKPQPKQPLVAPAKKGPHMEITTQFRYVGQNPELIRIKQLAGGDGLAFDLSGQLPNRTWMYNVATAVKDPDVYYFTALAQAMEEAGIHGNLRFQPWPGLNLPTKKIMVHSSIPLREVIVDINKHSNNLAAESLLRTMASQTKTAGISTEDGLNALRQVMETEFPGFQRDVVMKDGSGLDMENRVTSRFFVRLLNRVREKPFQSEYLASMSLAGWDGTLKPRHFPTRLWGNIRAKSGTLKGVKNLSGYLYAGGDVVVFSLMIKEDGRSVIKRERAQDSVMTALFDLLEEPRRSSTLEPAQAALP